MTDILQLPGWLIQGDFPLLDRIAVLWFLLCTVGYGFYSGSGKRRSRSIMGVMDRYRRLWMRQMLKRDNRMMDTSALRNLQQSITFLASTSILIIAGLSTLLGYRNEAAVILSHLPLAGDNSPLMYDMKLLMLMLLFVYAFFKFTWAMRTHNYSNILVAAAPLHHERVEIHEDYADRAGTLTANGARHFNSGLRAYYYGMATLSWFIHALIFIVAITLVTWVIYRREFRSHALQTLQSPYMRD